MIGGVDIQYRITDTLTASRKVVSTIKSEWKEAVVDYEYYDDIFIYKNEEIKKRCEEEYDPYNTTMRNGVVNILFDGPEDTRITVVVDDPNETEMKGILDAVKNELVRNKLLKES